MKYSSDQIYLFFSVCVLVIRDGFLLCVTGWYLEYIEIDAPSMGVKYKFPCGRWISKDHDDGQLERELYPGTEETVAYEAKVPYELTSKSNISLNVQYNKQRVITIISILTLKTSLE